MDWIQYIVFGLLLLFIVNRMLPAKGLTNLSAQQVKDLLTRKKEYTFVDVREPAEYKGGHIKGFTNIPLSQLANRASEINKEKHIVLTCRSGMRSRQAAKVLRKQGFTNISHLQTGVSGWDEGLIR